MRLIGVHDADHRPRVARATDPVVGVLLPPHARVAHVQLFGPRFAAETLGFHHIHLISENPDATLKWYQNVFGGQSDRLKGRIDGLRYGAVWLLIDKVNEGAMLAATQGRSIDHLGFAFDDLDAAAAEMKKKGVTFQSEPRPFTNAAGQNMKISFVVGPDDVRIEVVQPKA